MLEFTALLFLFLRIFGFPLAFSWTEGNSFSSFCSFDQVHVLDWVGWQAKDWQSCHGWQWEDHAGAQRGPCERPDHWLRQEAPVLDRPGHQPHRVLQHVRWAPEPWAASSGRCCFLQLPRGKACLQSRKDTHRKNKIFRPRTPFVFAPVIPVCVTLCLARPPFACRWLGCSES